MQTARSSQSKSSDRGRSALVAGVCGAAAILLALPAASHGAGACGNREAGSGDSDRVAGTRAGDRIKGRGGNDRLLGRGGEDCLLGGKGRDRLKGGPGRDRLVGGPGRDLLRARDGTRDVVVCGPGRDRPQVDGLDIVRGCRQAGRPSDGRYVPESKLGPVPADAYHVVTSGSDSNLGTAASPWLTLARAFASAGPGDTIVLGAGTYGAPGTTQSFDRPGAAGVPLTVRGDPTGPMPRILGHVRISADYQRLNYLLFDGPTGSVKEPTAENPRGEQVQVAINGSAVDGIEISDSEIRDSNWHAGIYACTANDVRITGNYIHDNGDPSDPGQDNQSHGIYFARGSGLIANNVIEHNVARGVQLYEGPHDVVVANNTIVRNGKAGIQFAAQTADSLAINNLVAYNGDSGIRSSSLTGSGNVVRQNLVWRNGHDLDPADGLTLFDNLRAHPGFGPRDDYRPSAASPAIDRAVGSYAPARDFDAVARPRGAAPDLGAFEVG